MVSGKIQEMLYKYFYVFSTEMYQYKSFKSDYFQCPVTLAQQHAKVILCQNVRMFPQKVADYIGIRRLTRSQNRAPVQSFFKMRAEGEAQPIESNQPVDVFPPETLVNMEQRFNTRITLTFRRITARLQEGHLPHSTLFFKRLAALPDVAFPASGSGLVKCNRAPNAQTSIWPRSGP